MTKKSSKRKFLFVGLGLLGVLVIVFLLGPRVEVDTKVTLPKLPQDLETYLQQRESKKPVPVKGTEKSIRWFHADKRKTKYAFVYLHGFSASRQETAPLTRNLAKKLGANIFYTRLTGHGIADHVSLGKAKVRDWLHDALEALEIGKRIGEKVILVSTSTGGTLATWLVAQYPGKYLAGNIMISPNFSPKNKDAQLFLYPWGLQIVHLIAGKTRSWKPSSKEEARYWTYKYPMRAVQTMMGLVDYVGTLDFQRIQVPTLMIYDPKDGTISVEKVKQRFPKFGSSKKKLVVFPSTQGHHVLAGKIVSPKMTPLVEKIAYDFLKNQVLTPSTKK